MRMNDDAMLIFAKMMNEECQGRSCLDCTFHSGRWCLFDGRPVVWDALPDTVEDVITKRRFRPKVNETYYYVNGGDEKDVYSDEFEFTIGDMENYAEGNCFRTEKEAIEHADEVFSRLKRRYDGKDGLA